MNVKPSSRRWVLALVVALLVTACGGSDGAKGDGAVTAPPPPAAPEPSPDTAAKAEGAYVGTTSEGFDLSMIVLENDVAWGLYERNGRLVGFVQGAGVSDDGSFTIPDAREYDFIEDFTRHGSVSATWFPGLSIQGSVVPDVGVQSSFTATTAAAVGYRYDEPAALAAVQGSWQGFFREGSETAWVDVSQAGAITAISSLGCTYTGSLVPHASGKNVYALTITFGGPPCLLAGGMASGIGLVRETAIGTRELLLAAIDVSREFGLTFIGQPGASQAR